MNLAHVLRPAVTPVVISFHYPTQASCCVLQQYYVWLQVEKFANVYRHERMQMDGAAGRYEYLDSCGVNRVLCMFPAEVLHQCCR